MKLVRSTLLSLATLAVVFIALLAGCSGSDPLSTTVGSLVLEFQITDPNATRFEEGDFVVSKVIVRPAEEQDLESLGGAGIALLANKLGVIDLNATSTALPAASLPAGTFLLEEISFFPSGVVPINLVDHDAVDPLAACIDRKTEFPGTTAEQALVARTIGFLSIDRRTFRPNAPILVPSGDAVSYPIRINSTLLIQAYKNAMTCSDSEFSCQIIVGGPPPCITSFNANAFIDELEGLDWINYGPE